MNILRIDASARRQGSVSRELGDRLSARLKAQHGAITVVERDLTQGLPLLNETWIGANFTAADQRDSDQRAALALSDTLIDEIRNADRIIMTVPVYNFGIPAALKAWVDLVCRAGETFRYTATGPQGLLEDRPTYLLMASGGTPIGSDIDFASGYLRHVLGFIGIHDIHTVAADQVMIDGEAAQARAHGQLDQLAA
ncbi:MAG: FMN-dependent NADH-azoreductase [Gammaproteobacteria bacterium]